jgi:hypothetical protein
MLSGSGTAAPSDTDLYRSAAGILRTSGVVQAAGFREQISPRRPPKP